MTIAEFKAWLEGYEASFDGAPSPEQFGEIKAKLARVFEAAPAYMPTYVAPTLPWYSAPPVTLPLRTCPTTPPYVITC